MGNASLFSKRVTRKDSMPMTQKHRGPYIENRCDRASAKEECSRFTLEGGVVVAALFWYAHLMETLQ
jgi:hypothetical protein